MFYSISCIVALPLLAHATVDILDHNHMVREPGILRYPIRVSRGALLQSLNKRLDDTNLTSRFSGNFYSIDIELGTPGQTISVNLDTGSSELWVNPSCSNSSNPNLCGTLGRFNSNASSTFNGTHQPGSVSYGSGFAHFEYAFDSVVIDSAKLNKQLFGVANDSLGSMSGILGVAPWVGGWDSPYPFVIDSLAEQGFTNSRAFGVDLRPIGSSRGSVIFGGIDTKKFSGHLEKLPIIPAEQSPDNSTRFWVYLDGLSVSTGNGDGLTVFDKAGYQPVFLDTGSTFCSFPTTMFEKLLKGFPSAQQRGPNVWSVDCPTVDSKVTIDFKFGNLEINVPLADFIWNPSKDVCILGVNPSDEVSVLGDSFLRTVYAVFDWDNRNVHLAKTEDCGSNLVPIGRGSDAVPSVISGCGKPTSMLLPTSTTGWHNTSSVSAAITSTVTASKVYTITSCPSYVTKCPVGSVTTEIITSLTTFCPVSEATVTSSETIQPCTESEGTTAAGSNIFPTVPFSTPITGSATAGTPSLLGDNSNSPSNLPAVTSGAVGWHIPIIAAVAIWAFAVAIC